MPKDIALYFGVSEDTRVSPVLIRRKPTNKLEIHHMTLDQTQTSITDLTSSVSEAVGTHIAFDIPSFFMKKG
jgi:hypothetical protein